MITAVLVAVMVFSDAAGDVLLARAMKRVGPIDRFHPRNWPATAARVLSEPSFAAGIAMAALHFASFLVLLSYAELSFVIPAAALVYVVSALGAHWILGETVSLLRWAGIGLVTLGVALVSST